MNKLNRYLPLTALMVTLIIVFYGVALRDHMEFFVWFFVIFYSLAVIFGWYYLRKTQTDFFYRRELESTVTIFPVCILISFLTLGMLSIILVPIMIYALALVPSAILNSNNRKQDLKRSKKTSLKFTVFMIVIIVVIFNSMWTKNIYTINMRWSYNEERTKNDCDYEGCKWISFQAVDTENCNYRIDIESPDLGSKLEKLESSLIPVVFEVEIFRESGGSISEKSFANIAKWKTTDRFSEGSCNWRKSDIMDPKIK